MFTFWIKKVPVYSEIKEHHLNIGTMSEENDFLIQHHAMSFTTLRFSL